MFLDDRYVPEGYMDQAEDAYRRALASGARTPLRFLGIGMTAIVFTDDQGTAYKVARKGTEQAVEEEAKYIEVASSIPDAARNVVRFYRYDPVHAVLWREALEGKKPSDNSSWKAHKHLEGVMRQYGYGAPEYKPESYIMVRGRGPVLFDASMPALYGRALVKYALDLASGRIRRSDPYGNPFRDAAWAVNWERGRTIPSNVVDGVLVKLARADKGALAYLEENEDTMALAKKARNMTAGKRTSLSPNDVRTYAVAGSAYGGSRAQLLQGSSLLHSVNINYDPPKPLCGKVKATNLLDDPYAIPPHDDGNADVTTPPTCPICLSKDPRFANRTGGRRNMAIGSKHKTQKFSIESISPGRFDGDFVVEVRLEAGGFATVRTTPSRVSVTGQSIVSSTSPLSASQERTIEKAVAKQSKNKAGGRRNKSGTKRHSVSGSPEASALSKAVDARAKKAGRQPDNIGVLLETISRGDMSLTQSSYWEWNVKYAVRTYLIERVREGYELTPRGESYLVASRERKFLMPPGTGYSV